MKIEVAPPIILVIEMVKNLASCLPNVIKSPFLCMVSGMCLAYIEMGDIKSFRGQYWVWNDRFDFERWECDKLNKWEREVVSYSFMLYFVQSLFTIKINENFRFSNLRKCGFQGKNHIPDVLYSDLPTQLSQRLQWEARGGRNILHVKQYFNLTTCPLITTSLVLGGGR